MKSLKSKNKKYLVIAICFIISLLIELFIFNFGAVVNRFATYNLNDLCLYNWISTNSGIVSDLDPKIVIFDINDYVYNIRIDVKDKRTYTTY